MRRMQTETKDIISTIREEFVTTSFRICSYPLFPISTGEARTFPLPIQGDACICKHILITSPYTRRKGMACVIHITCVSTWKLKRSNLHVSHSLFSRIFGPWNQSLKSSIDRRKCLNHLDTLDHPNMNLMNSEELHWV